MAPREPRDFTLRLSNIGSKCVRKLWLEKNNPVKFKPSGSTKLKFLYGHIIESLLIFLTELSGHKVEGRQGEIEIAGIKGHKDVVIDGHLVDKKSASSMSFDNFQKGLTKETDKFGYITQLLGYLHGSKDDPVVLDKDSASFLVMDKQHGHLHLDTHVKDPEVNFEEAFEQRKAEVNSPDIPPRSFEPIPDGYNHKVTKEFVPNGNMKLDTYCSYCEQKFNCHDNIRTFLYSDKPRYFTKIVKEPNVYEVKE